VRDGRTGGGGSGDRCAGSPKTIRKTPTKPRYIISDQGPQFWSEGFKGWCGRHDLRPRFGAVGKHGSIAVVERSVKRPALQQRDRIFWAWLSRLWDGWRMPVILEGESFRGPPGIGRLRNVSKSLVMA